MCEFASWVEYKGEAYFLTNAELETKEGKELLKPDCIADISGHGGIRSYYPELKGNGTNKECVDFSTPANFPKDMVKAIKQGNMSKIGIALDILNEAGKKEYQKIHQSAYDEYQKIVQSAYDEYQKIHQSAYDEYQKIHQSAYANIVKQAKYRVKAWK